MNTFGNNFRLTTFGESHGVAIGGVIDGCPSGVVIDKELLNVDLCRRRGEGMQLTTSRREADDVEWLSGVVDGVTIGTPVAFAVRNGDTRAEDYESLRDVFRAGHADYAVEQRYGARDYRGGGRASGRETVARVVAGAVAKQLLRGRGISVEASARVRDDLSDGESYGGQVIGRVVGVPAGVGNPIVDRLNARLAMAMMSIPSATAFEMGIGCGAAMMTGRQYADQWNFDDEGRLIEGQPTQTNHCGGVQGGISNGMPIEFTVTFHAPVTQMGAMTCLTRDGRRKDIEVVGRHDRCHVLRLPVVVEAMAAITIADYIRF